MKVTNLLTALIMLASAGKAMAQHDSTYYETHNDVMHVRLYFIQKHATFSYKNPVDDISTKYSPHTLPGLGVGFTYNWLTLNVSFGLPLNGNESEKGRTKYLDVRLNVWAKKFIVDFSAQSFKGLYLQGDKDASGVYYHRPDVQARLLGGAFQYVLNNKRFSSRSSFLLTDWQKKSAGSLLVGFNAYVGRVTADSSLLRYRTMLDPSGPQEKKDLFWQIGPTLGYAYTLVIKRHLFLTGSFAESLNYGRRITTEPSEQVATSNFAINPSYRLVAGYHTYRWGFSASYVNNRVNIASKADNDGLAISAGTYRVNVVYRFKSKGKVGELIDKI